MSPILDKALCDRFPMIFGDRNAPMNQTAMCWGFSHGDGWFLLLWNLCLKIEAILKEADKENALAPTKATKEPKASAFEQFRVTQVKEKFGTLRFYANFGSDGLATAINEAERLSGVTCEECGQPAILRHQHTLSGDAQRDRHSGWLFTACDEHSRNCPRYGCYVDPNSASEHFCRDGTTQCSIDHAAEEAADLAEEEAYQREVADARGRQSP